MKKNKLILIIALVLLIPLALELFLSNLSSACAHIFTKDAPEVKADIKEFTSADLPWGEKAFLVDSQSSSFEFTELDINVHSLSFKAQNESGISSPLPPKLEIYGMDENLTQYYVLYRTEDLATGNTRPEENLFFFSGSGKISAIALFFDLEDDNVIISDLTFNPSFTLRFNTLRFFILLLLSVFIALVKVFKLNTKKFDPKTKAARLAVLTLALLSAAVSIVIGIGMCTGIKTISYPASGSLDKQSPYVQQFDAFLKGQLHLDVEPSEELKELEDPYDTSLRENGDYLWDRAYYKGKYYSYFGIAPILTFYFPFYLVSSALPSDALVITFFASVSAIMICLVLFEFTKLLKRPISYLTFILSVPAVLSASMLFIMQRGFLPYYYVATVSAFCFALMTLFFLMKAAFASRNKALRPILFSLSGLSFGLLILSRINVAFLVGILCLAILAVYLKRHLSDLPTLLTNLGFFAVLPLCAVLTCFVLNYIRFESIFEFGAKYQLTVSNVSYNTFSADLFLPSLYHYFFQGFEYSGQFPYVDVSGEMLTSYGRYLYYGSLNAGIFAMPLNLYIFTARSALTEYKKAVKLVSISAIAGLVLVAFTDICLGGVILRYTADISLIASLIAVFFLYTQSDHTKERRLSHSVMIITSLIGFFLIFNKSHVDFCDYSSEIYLAVKGIFTV